MSVADGQSRTGSAPNPVDPGIFSPYSKIALIANSEALDIDVVERAFPSNTLFVFFTRCPRVLSRPFTRDAILCHRMKDAHTFNEGEKHVGRARALFAPGALKSEIGIIAHDVPEAGAPMPSAAPVETASDRVGLLLDLDSMFSDFYTPGMTPTTGFAMAVWLLENVPQAEVTLCGFTGVRGPDFRMRIMHDWSLEQTVLRLFARQGRLCTLSDSRTGNDALSRITERFPQYAETTVAKVAADVLSDRINALDRLVSMLWSVSRAPRALHRFAANFKLRRPAEGPRA